MLCEFPVDSEDISPILGSVCSGFVVSSIMECLSALLISQMKTSFVFVFAELSRVYLRVKKSGLDNSCLWNGGQYCEDTNIPLIDLQFQCTPHQNPSCLCAEIDELILKFIWKDKEPRVIAKINLKKKNTVGGLLTLSDFRTYHKAIINKTVWYWHRIDKDR